MFEAATVAHHDRHDPDSSEAVESPRLRLLDRRDRGYRHGLGRVLAAERGTSYDLGDSADEVGDLGYRSIVDDDPTGAIDEVGAAVDRLARCRPDTLSPRRQLDAYATLERHRRRLEAQQARLLEAIRADASYTEHACVSVGGWLKQGLRLDPTIGIQRERIAERLRHFDQVREAWQVGDIDAPVVHEICKAAIPQRRDAIVEAEAALLQIGKHGTLTHLRNAIAKIRVVVDPDGTDTCEKVEPGLADPRRDLRVSKILDGLSELNATLTQLPAEMLLTLLDAYDEPDPPDTPEHLRRSPGQRRHDAFARALRTALDLAEDLPERQGRRPHLALYCDLQTLLDHLWATAPDPTGDGGAVDVGGEEGVGHAGAATTDGPAPGVPAGSQDGDGPRLVEGSAGAWLRFTGPCPPELARQLAVQASVTAILGMGDWRPVAVGRTHRTAPPWLRHAIEWVHRHCRGPGCDRPVTWTQAAHTGLAWAAGGQTRLDEQMPACTPHHQLIDLHGWQVEWDHDTNIVTWTSPDGQITVQTRPPPQLE